MNMNADQTKLPLQEALRSFREEAPALFRIPVHHFADGADPETRELLGDAVFNADLTEAEGLDDLHAPEGAIAEAQQLAADLFGSEECFFLVNGSTSGNEAAVLTCAGPGEKILLARNAHVSVLQGLILSGAGPVWLEPEPLGDSMLDGPVKPEQVEEALCREPDCRAFFLTSPTYYGICSPVKEIAGICHRHGIPLLVDEAHGSHLYFSEDMPEGAVSAGADLVIQSLHKTGGSMTQSSLLHRSGPLIDGAKLRESIRLVTSTSPSYVLMASLDGARHQLALRGRELAGRAKELADLCRKELNKIEGIQVLSDPAADPLRVVFSLASAGISGIALQKELYERGRVSVELADLRYAVCVIGWGNTEDEIRRLAGTVEEIRREVKPDLPDNVTYTAPEALPEICMTPREVWERAAERIPAEEAAGRIAAESISPYPPGVPLIVQGEKITEDILEKILLLRELQIPVHGPEDRSLRMIRVVS